MDRKTAQIGSIAWGVVVGRVSSHLGMTRLWLKRKRELHNEPGVPELLRTEIDGREVVGLPRCTFGDSMIPFCGNLRPVWARVPKCGTVWFWV